MVEVEVERARGQAGAEAEAADAADAADTAERFSDRRRRAVRPATEAEASMVGSLSGPACGRGVSGPGLV